MAGSGWSFLVEYDGKPESLMRSLETHVFQSGRFDIPIVEPEFLDEIDFFSVSDEEREEMAEQYGLEAMLTVARRVGFADFVPWCVERMKTGRVETLEELRAMQCLSSSGTHSPLDMSGISDAPEDFKLYPLADDQILKVFGTSRVRYDDVASRDMFVARSLPEAYANWQGVFVPVYTGDSITHAYVEGASGD